MTKKSTFFVLSLFFTITTFAQHIFTQENTQVTHEEQTLVMQPSNFFVSKPVRDLPTCDDLTTFDGKFVPKNGINSSYELSDKRKRKLGHLQSAGRSSISEDPLAANSFSEQHQTATRAPLTSFEGIGQDISPPDPSMAVGPNHVVTMENGAWAVYDKSGNIFPGFPRDLNDPLSGPNHADNAGDPVVMYDREADRWFISQFQLSGIQSLSDDVFLIGISTTPDPTGTYNVYEYELTQGNDYPHYGIWGDSYVTAGNFTGAQKVYTFNRAKMLVGDPTAEIVGFSPTSLGASGFAAPIPVHSEGAGTATGPIKILYYQDDAFTGVTSDHIGLWNINMNWTNATGTISSKIQIPVSDFDAAIAGGFSNLQQPGTNVRIDAIVGAVMNMSLWYEFGTHQSILLNWVVEITDGSQISGIRWVELRSTDNGANWSVHQEGTFTDPTGNESVFMGCMSMDIQGNIGLGYTKTGGTTFPSLYYTGRMASDPLGTMTVAEDLVIAGNTVTTNDRYGDYGQAVRDPNDDLTFWVTSEYSGAPDKKVRVYSFKLGTEFDDDVGITAVTAPTSGSGLTNAETVTVTIANQGLNAQSNIPVTLSLDGTPVASETFTGTISGGSSANYTFTQTVDLSTLGQTYSLQACTNLGSDENSNNDCTTATISHIAGTDLAVTALVNPSSGIGLTATEDVIFTLENLGGDAQSNIPLVITIDGGTPINGTFPGPLAAGASINLNLAGVADVSALGGHTICVQVNQTNDADTDNDLLCVDITNLDCVGTAGSCNIDGIKQVILAGITVDDGGSGCNTENDAGILGYANRTDIVFELDRFAGQNTYVLQARTDWNPEAFELWIDFNDNGTFESGEQLLDTDFTVEDTLDSFNLIIPTDANLGSHVMRMRAYDSSAAGTPNNPCGDVQFGETHDYTVTIVDSSLGSCPLTTTYTTSWDNGVPTASMNAIINGDYNTTTASIDACSLVVNGNLTVSPNTYVNIVNDIEVTTMATMTVMHQGSVVQIDPAGSATNAGTITVEVTTATMKPRDFMILGSPMNADAPSGVDNPIFRKLQHNTVDFLPHPDVQLAFPGGANFVDADNNDVTLQSGNFAPAKGYYVWPQASLQDGNTTYDLLFENGTFNTGETKYSLVFNNVGAAAENKNASPNVLSNPYPSAISGSDFLAANPAADELYFWEHNSTPNNSFPGANSANFNMADISVFNAMGFNPASTGSPIASGPGDISIATGQGFSIKNNGAATDVTFTNSMRRTTNNNTLRTPQDVDRLLLSIKDNNYNLGSTTLIGFTENATRGYDAGYDSEMLGAPVTIFSHINDGTKALAIQGREAFNTDIEISLGFISQIDKNNSYTISIKNMEGSQLSQATVYLIDTETNEVTNLLEEDYNFTSTKGIFNNRFIVKFVDNEVLGNSDIALDAIALFPNPTRDNLTISSPTSEILTVEILDITGSVIINSTVNARKTSLDLSKQNTAVYFAKITTQNGVVTKKIIKK